MVRNAILVGARGRRSMGTTAVVGLVTAVMILSFPSPASAAGGAPVSQADLVASHTDFESADIPSPWVAQDDNPAGGSDYWGVTSGRAAAGVGSAWVAKSGSHTDSTVVFEEGFESGAIPSAWTVQDTNSEYGDDYWGITDVRANGTSTYSVWCAQEGWNDESYWEEGRDNYNVELGKYDSYMDAELYRSVTLTGFTAVDFIFWTWYDNEVDWDYVRPVYYDGGWEDLVLRGANDYNDGIDGNSNGWIELRYTIPATATRVGFIFSSDTYVIQEGTYIDDVSVVGYTTVQNTVSGLYDNEMEATLTRPVDVSPYETSRVDYRYWLDSEAGQDYLYFEYFTTAWNVGATHDGNSGGWVSGSVAVPTNTTAIRFRFTSDDSGRAEGAFLDEISVVGTVPPPECTGYVSSLVGTERSTEFFFAATVAGGWPPLSWSWDFGDGTGSQLQGPSHTYQDPGSYPASLVITDSLGQSCAAELGSIEVTYDTSEIYVQPYSPQGIDVVEGSSQSFYAETRYGHQAAFTWSVAPPNCGEITGSPGNIVTFNASIDFAGASCTLTAMLGGDSGAAPLNVLVDRSGITVTPPSAVAFSNDRVVLTATTPYGHPFEVDWFASCGRVLPGYGSSTTFTAIAVAGSVCVVSAESGTIRTTVPISILQDPRNMTVTPTEAHVIEGQGASFEARDSFGKPLAVDWSVTPGACGDLSVAFGASTLLETSADAGGSSCRVAGSVSGYGRNATVIVAHDLSGGGVTLSVETVRGGEGVEAAAFDKNGHALSVDWSVSPANCGELSPQSGATTTMTTSEDIGEVVCTLTARAGTLTLIGLVSVELGPPSSIEVTFSGAAPEGGQTEARAQVRDAGGHALDSSGVAWTTTCAGLSRATGATTLVTAPEDGAGTTCTVTASFGGVTGTGNLQITRGPAARIEIQPSNIQVANGERVELTLKAWDQYDHEVVPTTVIWAASCGSFEGEGVTVTYIAPASGGPCQISATVPGGTVGVSASSSVGVSGGLLVPLVLVAVVAAAAVAGLLLWRRAKGGGNPPA